MCELPLEDVQHVFQRQFDLLASDVADNVQLAYSECLAVDRNHLDRRLEWSVVFEFRKVTCRMVCAAVVQVELVWIEADVLVLLWCVAEAW